MDIFQDDNYSDGSILDNLNKDMSQKNEFNEKDLQFEDNALIDKEIIKNLNHRNFLKIVEFGINRNTCGPYEFGVKFNAKYFMNIIREYLIKLNCTRLNFFVSDKIIYFYGIFERKLRVYTKINTQYISPDLVDIIEGFGKEFRANFDVNNLLKNLELTYFTNKDHIKMYFVFNQNNINKSKVRKENQDDPNPFFQGDIYQVDQDFNFEKNAIPGHIIIESQKIRLNVECNFAPSELSTPPKIPSSIFSDYILSLSIDKLNSAVFKVSSTAPLEIYCNHYICNFVSNVNSEHFLTYDKSEGVEFKYDKAINFCKKIDPEIDGINLFKKMIHFKLKKHELDALKIINKKTSVIHFYATKAEKYYFTKETNEQGNIASAIIICSSDDKPSIDNIENCCFYPGRWNEWINCLKNILPSDCINELEKLRKNSEIENYSVNASTNNRKKKNRNQQKKSSVKNDNSKINLNKNIDANKENELESVPLFSNDKKGGLKKISYNEIKDLGREEILKENENVKKKVNVNPFSFK